MSLPRYLYHATPAKNLPSIQEKGLVPVLGAVYATDDIRAAHWFASSMQHDLMLDKHDKSKAVAVAAVPTVILKIDTRCLDDELLGTAHEMLCDILKTSDFWHYYGTVPPKALTVVCNEHDAA